MTLKEASKAGLSQLLKASVLGIALGLALSANAQTEFMPAPRTISVTGAGAVSAVPNLFHVSMGIETEHATLTEALAQNNGAVESVLALLATLGIESRDIKTTSFYVSETYDPEGKPNGFRVVNNLAVTIRDVNLTGMVVDQAIQAGVNRIAGIQMSISDTSALERTARALAVEDARTKARELANQAGMQLGDPVSITESGGIQPRFDGRASALELSPVPIAPGEQVVSVRVDIIYEMLY